ncbi:MAG TPA: cupredoxin domain-containing protein [Thermomicrobiales bacterium]|nr:cupredoxin domain-containing protein [Thermomicrobiales bacterium]
MATDIHPNGTPAPSGVLGGTRAGHDGAQPPIVATHAAVSPTATQAPPAPQDPQDPAWGRPAWGRRAVVSWDHFLLGQITFALIVALVFGVIAYAAGGAWPPRAAATGAATGAATAITAFSQAAAAQRVAVAADPSGALKWDRATYEARAGDVSFVVTNDSAMTHNFALTGPGVNVQGADLGPHSSGTFTIKGLPAGQYEIACNVAGHKLAGMVATLIVK